MSINIHVHAHGRFSVHERPYLETNEQSSIDLVTLFTINNPQVDVEVFEHGRVIGRCTVAQLKAWFESRTPPTWPPPAHTCPQCGYSAERHLTQGGTAGQQEKVDA